MPSGFSVISFSCLLLTLSAGDAWSDIPQYVMFEGHTDISAREGSIISHSGFNNGDYYPNFYDATATFINLPADRNTNITLKFVKFEVENDPPCNDYLLIDGTRYCGNGLDGTTKRYQIRASSFTLTFHTDWTRKDVGFKIQFTVIIEPVPTTLPKPMSSISPTISTPLPAITHAPTITESTSPGTETLTAAGTTEGIEGGSSDSSTAKYVSNMQLDGISLLGIIGAVAALVVICIVITTVLVIRHKKKLRSQEAQQQPGSLGLTQSNHDAANHIYGNMSDPITDQTADQYTSVTLTAGAAEDTHVYSDLQADHYTSVAVTAREGDTHVYTDLQTVHSQQRP